MHNAEFDEGFLNAEFARLKMPPLAKVAAKVVCSLILARRMHPQLPSHSLDYLCGHFRVDNSARVKHGALTDARLLAQVYLRMTLEQMTFALPGARVKSAAANADSGGEVWLCVRAKRKLPRTNHIWIRCKNEKALCRCGGNNAGAFCRCCRGFYVRAGETCQTGGASSQRQRQSILSARRRYGAATWHYAI